MHKLEDEVNGNWVEHVHLPVYETSGTETSRPRLFFGARHDAPELLRALAAGLRPPYFVLYILHTPRGEAEPGRYQSEAIEAERLGQFLKSYRAYLVSDGRFDIWIHSLTDNATLVWDRHNYVYAYGPLDRHATTLERFGYQPGEVDGIGGRPHMHFYRSECDTQAEAMMEEFDWAWSPLKPVDEQ